MKNFFVKRILSIFLIIVLSACGTAETIKPNTEKTLGIPEEFHAELAITGETEDIVFDVNAVKHGNTLAISFSREIDGIIFVVDGGKVRIKYADIDLEVKMPKESFVLKLYNLVKDFDKLEKLTTSENNNKRISVSTGGYNYELNFTDNALKTISTPQFRLNLK